MAAPAMPVRDTKAPALSRAERRAKWWLETKGDLKWAIALLFVLILGLSGYFWVKWSVAPAGEEDIGAITTAIFGTDKVPAELVIPFEVLSVLLLAALIAGVVIAFRDPEVEN